METERDCTLSMFQANLLVFLSAGPIVAILALAYAARWGADSLERGVYQLLHPAVFLLSVGGGAVAHELIHALGWAWFARRPLSSIRIGFHWRGVSPYAHPKDPMPVGPYRAGALLPGLVLGLGPAAAAIALGWPALMAWSLVFTLAAGGDLIVLWLLRGVEAGRVVRDHPTRAGCEVLDP
jgi:hypothetical protein